MFSPTVRASVIVVANSRGRLSIYETQEIHDRGLQQRFSRCQEVTRMRLFFMRSKRFPVGVQLVEGSLTRRTLYAMAGVDECARLARAYAHGGRAHQLIERCLAARSH